MVIKTMLRFIGTVFILTITIFIILFIFGFMVPITYISNKL